MKLIVAEKRGKEREKREDRKGERKKIQEVNIDTVRSGSLGLVSRFFLPLDRVRFTSDWQRKRHVSA